MNDKDGMPICGVCDRPAHDKEDAKSFVHIDSINADYCITCYNMCIFENDPYTW